MSKETHETLDMQECLLLRMLHDAARNAGPLDYFALRKSVKADFEAIDTARKRLLERARS
jgi:hypothetical protein